jgi:hypothetical protein
LNYIRVIKFDFEFAMCLFKLTHLNCFSAAVFTAAVVFALSSCNSNKTEWKEYEQSAQFAKEHPNQKGNALDSLGIDGKLEDAARAEKNYDVLGSSNEASGNANKGAAYNKGYQIGYDSGLSDGRDNSKGANASSIDPSGLGFYGENAVRYQEGFNAGYEEGYAKSQMVQNGQFSTEEDRENAKAANANYMKTTGAEIAKEEAKARQAAENEVKARQAERDKRKQEIEKEAYEKVKNSK